MRLLLLFLLVSLHASSQNLLIKNISVVDVENGKIIPNQSILITGNKITSVGTNVKAPKGAQSIDGAGKYLMPGLWDMHVHTVGSYRSMLPMFVAYGVTGVREMGTEFVDTMVYLRKMINEQKIVGPSIYGTGPVLDGSPIILKPTLDLKLQTPQEAIHAVDSIAAKGVDFLKVYEMLTPEVFLAIADAAKKHTLSFVGHLPIQLDVTTAVNAGMKSLEHLVGLEREFSLQADSIRREETILIKNFTSPNGLQLLATIRRKRFAATSGTFDDRKAKEICSLLKSKNVYVTPTLIVLVRYARRDDLAAQKNGADQFVDPKTKSDWNGQWERLLKDTAFASSEKRTQSLMKMTNTLYQNGVMLLAGTDCPNSWVIPGFSLHREFEYLNEAGVSNADILRMATINPARFMNKEKETGSIAAGKYADLVILSDNPLKEITNTQRIDAVILKGKFLQKEDLDNLKKSASAQY